MQIIEPFIPNSIESEKRMYHSPRDVDGNELHIGDWVEYCAQPDPYKPDPYKPVPKERKFKIHSLHLYERRWWIGDRHTFEVDAKDVRVCYKAPTVEDILDEMLNEFVDFINTDGNSPSPASMRTIVNRYRDKLQIKE